ncbi:hypothetical protein J6590_009414 [Homalodisca vitripennis]|nr:hypothetical protein J6590_009414 [Homalodisca vitripennis]
MLKFHWARRSKHSRLVRQNAVYRPRLQSLRSGGSYRHSWPSETTQIQLSAYLCRMHTALSPDTARQSSCRCCNPTPLAAGPMRTVSMPRRD